MKKEIYNAKWFSHTPPLQTEDLGFVSFEDFKEIEYKADARKLSLLRKELDKYKARQ